MSKPKEPTIVLLIASNMWLPAGAHIINSHIQPHVKPPSIQGQPPTIEGFSANVLVRMTKSQLDEFNAKNNLQ